MGVMAQISDRNIVRDRVNALRQAVDYIDTNAVDFEEDFVNNPKAIG